MNGGNTSSNSDAESRKPTRRGRKKSASPSSTPPPPSSSSSSAGKTKKRSRKIEAENGAVAVEPVRAQAREEEDEGGDDWEYDDGINSYDDPPLVCCFGAARWELVPTVRVHHNPDAPGHLLAVEDAAVGPARVCAGSRRAAVECGDLGQDNGDSATPCRTGVLRQGRERRR